MSFDYATSLVSMTAPAKPAGRGAYDSSENSPEHRRHWKNAKDLAPNITNDRRTRQTLRVRARYETDNNTYCRGMITTIGCDVIGSTAPQLVVLTPDNGFNEYVESEWKRWSESEEVNLPFKWHLLDECRRVEGEGFSIYFTDDEAGAKTGHSLNCNIISPRRIINPAFGGMGVFAQPDSKRYNDDGVIIDTQTGRPVTFQVTNELDELNNASIASRVESIQARYCKQWFGPTRPQQYRGVSEIQAALPMFAYMRRFELATVSTAEIVAAFTAFMKTNLPPGEQPVSIAEGAWSEREIIRGMLTSLPEGWEPFVLDPKHPPTTFEMFLNMILRGIGRVLNMPFGVVAGDHSKYNFASGRLEYRLYDDRNMKDRQQFTIRILNPLHAEWLAEFARDDPRVRRMVDTNKYYHMWRFPRRQSINPKEDAETEDIRLKNGTTTYAEVFADRGQDWDDAFEQRKKETEKINKLGLDKVFDGGDTTPPKQLNPVNADAND